MILGSVCIGFIVMLVQSVEGERRGQRRKQAKLSLDIANKTLPLFRQVNSESPARYAKFRHDIHADAVAITNTHVLAYVGVGNLTIRDNDDLRGQSPRSRRSITEKIIIKTTVRSASHTGNTPCW